MPDFDWTRPDRDKKVNPVSMLGLMVWSVIIAVGCAIAAKWVAAILFLILGAILWMIKVLSRNRHA